MNAFKRTISAAEFNFSPIREGKDLVFNISVDSHQFKMIANDKGSWHIWQQVPRWIKELEPELNSAIEEQKFN
jgi:hypothetical protein